MPHQSTISILVIRQQTNPHTLQCMYACRDPCLDKLEDSALRHFLTLFISSIYYIPISKRLGKSNKFLIIKPNLFQVLKNEVQKTISEQSEVLCQLKGEWNLSMSNEFKYQTFVLLLLLLFFWWNYKLSPSILG